MTARGGLPRSQIAAFLNSLDDYVVLRNHDIWRNFFEGGDIDVLVGDAQSSYRRMIAFLGRPVWSSKRSYVFGATFGWGHIDLLPSLEWRGATYLSVDQVLASSTISQLGFRQPRKAHEAISSWFAGLLWGGFFPARYGDVIAEAASSDGEELRTCLQLVLGRKWGEQLAHWAANGDAERSASYVRELRRRVWWHAFRRDPGGTLARWITFWVREVQLRMFPPLPRVTIYLPEESVNDHITEQLTHELETTRVFQGVEVSTGGVDSGARASGTMARNDRSLWALARLLWNSWFDRRAGILNRRARGWLYVAVKGLRADSSGFSEGYVEARGRKMGGPSTFLSIDSVGTSRSVSRIAEKVIECVANHQRGRLRAHPRYSADGA